MTTANPEFDRWESYFAPGERLLWQGAPLGDARVTWLQVFLAAFGVPFAMAGLGLMGGGVTAFLSGPEAWSDVALAVFVTCFGVPFASAGLAMIFGPYLAARLAPFKIRYALSDRCLYIAKRWWKPVMEVSPISATAPITLTQTRVGWTVSLFVATTLDNDGDKVKRSADFEMIADGPEVYRILRAVQGSMA